MPVSQVDIFNFALGHIGHTETVGTPTENSKAAKTCLRFYEHARDTVLQAFPWNFCTRAVALATVAGATFPGYEYLYGYPSDCLNLRQLTDEDGSRTNYTEFYQWQGDRVVWHQPRVPFQIASDATAGKIILTDVADAYAIYTARVEDTTLYDSAFVETFSRYLAYQICPSLTADEKKSRAALGAYRLSLSEAWATQLNEGHPDRRPESPSISGRW